MWTQFVDMHSGGGQKGQWNYIYIEAPEEEAQIIFYNKFGHNPNRVTCTCCGADYSITSGESLRQLTGFHRNCRSLETPKNDKGRYERPKDSWFGKHFYLEVGEEEEAQRRGYKVSDYNLYGKYQTLEEYSKNADVLLIHAQDIKPEERVGEVPEQGYVWV